VSDVVVTCSRTLAVSMGIVAVSATHPASPALTNLTATPGVATSPLAADDIVADAGHQTALTHTHRLNVHNSAGFNGGG